MYIKNLDTNDGYLANVELEFSPGLNCIIGARGSCKSTIVETIRFLFDENADRVKLLVSDASGADDQARGDGLIRETLQRGIARVGIALEDDAGDDSATTIERSLGTDPVTRLEGVRTVDRDYFAHQVEIYSQGELQEIASSSAKRLALVDKPNAVEIGIHLDDAAARAQDVAALGPQIRELRQAISSSQAQIQSLLPLREELMKARAERPALSPEVTRQREIFEEEQSRLAKTQASIAEYADAMQALAAVSGQFGSAAGRIEAGKESKNPIVGEIVAAIEASSATVHAVVDKVAQEAWLREKFREAQDVFESDSEKYRAAIDEEQSVTNALRLEDQLSAAVAKLDDLEEDLRARNAKLRELESNRSSLRKRASDSRAQAFKLRVDEVAELNSRFASTIVLTLTHGKRRTKYRSRLDNLVAGSRLRDQAGLAKQIAEEIEPEAFVTLVDDASAEELAQILNREVGQMMRLISYVADAKGLYELEGELADDDLDITMYIKDEPRSVSDMSSGERATAILPLLLRKADYPLILDQPEDDLDNRFIFEQLVEQLHGLKDHRQMIFVTHNANIPVNGGADKVFVMNMSGPREAILEKVGTVEETKDSIIRLLEGGEEAFERRGSSYGFNMSTLA